MRYRRGMKVDGGVSCAPVGSVIILLGYTERLMTTEALAGNSGVLVAESRSEWLRLARTRGGSIGLVDLDLMGVEHLPELRRATARFPVIAVTGCTQRSMLAVKELSEAGIIGVLVKPFGLAQIQSALIEAGRTSFVAELQRSLNDQMPMMSEVVRDALEAAMLHPETQTICALCRRLGVSLRTLERHFHVAGLATPRRCLTAARVAHYCGAIRRGTLAKEAAALSNFRESRQASRTTQRVLGCVRSRDLLDLPCSVIANRIARWLGAPCEEQHPQIISAGQNQVSSD
jgi:ActR/RegA family two-component response regulator